MNESGNHLLLVLLLFFLVGVNFTAIHAQCAQAGSGWYTDQGIDVAGCTGESVNAPYEAWSNELYFTTVIAGGNYTFDLVGCSQTAWGAQVQITVWEGATSQGPRVLAPSTLTGGTAIASVSNTCTVSFTATVSDTIFFVISTVGGCGGSVQQIDNGTPTVTTTSGVPCGVCGNAICDIPGETYCNCDADCDCSGGAAVFADMNPIAISPNPVAYCPITLGDTVNSVPFRVFIPIAPFSSGALPSCITGWHVSTTEGSLLRSTATPTALTPSDTVDELSIFYLSVTDADIAASGGQTTLTFTDATGPGTCQFTFDVDWTGTILDDDGAAWAGSANAACGCSPPEATILSFDCSSSTAVINVSDPGLPSSGSSGYTWSVAGGSAPPQLITTAGMYSFALDNSLQTWDIIATDGANDVCDAGVFRIYPDCRTICGNGSNLLLENDFETIPTMAWAQVSESMAGPTGNDVINNINPVFGALDGSGAAIMGALGLTNGVDTLYKTSISQVVTIEPGATAALYFWGWLVSCDTDTDLFTLTVNGNTEITIDGGHARCGDGNWYEYAVDLTPYAGGVDDTILLTLNEFEINGGATVLFIDEMVLEHCTSCPTSLNLSGNSSGDASFFATQTINSSQIIVAPDSVNYIAGNESNLLNNFEAQLGSTLHVNIDDCIADPPTAVRWPQARRQHQKMDANVLSSFTMRHRPKEHRSMTDTTAKDSKQLPSNIPVSNKKLN